jgi:ribosomal protein S12 methylthiotransferase accessory factor
VKAALRSCFINPQTEALAYRLDDDSHTAVSELLALYSPSCGPVRKAVTHFGAVAGYPSNVGHIEYYDIDHVLRRVTGMSSLDTGMRNSLFAGGKGFTIHDMFVASLGEMVERLIGSMHHFSVTREHLYGTYQELTERGFRCLSPEELPLFSPQQYADPDFLYEPYTERSMLGWLVGTRLFSGEQLAVPAQLVELFYAYHPDEAVIGYAVSGGLSSHLSRTHALFHGITELIERDAINLRWYCGIPPARVVLDRPPATPELQRLLDRTAGRPGEIGVYYHSVDIPEVPVLTAMEINPWRRRYGYCAGGGADIDADVALLKTLNEFGQSERTIALSLVSPARAFARGSARLFDIDPDAPVSKINLFFQVIGYYGHRKNVAKLDWYLQSNETVALSSLPHSEHSTMEAKWAALCEILRRHRLDPIIFDLTPPTLRQVKLLKVFMPELTQAFLQSRPVLGHPRFAQAAQLLGRSNEPMSYDELWRDPLPYP